MNMNDMKRVVLRKGTLHVETPLGIVNVRVGLTDAKGQRVNSVEVLANNYAGEPKVKRDGNVNTRLVEQTYVPLKNGAPRYVRCYDNGGKTADRYTVVFTGRRAQGAFFPYLGMSANPFHPQGIGQHGTAGRQGPTDRPTSRHLGKRIPFSELPDQCRALVLRDYLELWS
jgi:hypothetical protein